MTSQEVAKSIIEQLEYNFGLTINGHKVSFLSYIGAKKPFTYTNNGLQIIVPNKKKLLIELNGLDLYNVSLYDYKYFRYDEFIKDIGVGELRDTILRMLGVD